MAQRPRTGALRTTVVKLTDVGKSRDHNEDTVRIEIPPEKTGHLQAKGALYIVADGMGGHEAGEVASEIAIQTFPQAYYAAPPTDIRGSLIHAARQANHAVFSRAQQMSGRKGMGTTLVAAAVRNTELYVVHVGDSRAYRLTPHGRFEALTKDHSWVQEQINAGILTEEMARNHPQKNVITKALGHGPDVEPTVSGPIPLQSGDIILLCSDGLSGPVRDEEMVAILKQFPPQEAVTRLIDLANARGGPDNVTAIVAQAEPWQSGQSLARELAPVPAMTGNLSGPQPGPPQPPPATTTNAPGGIPWKWVGLGVAALVAAAALITIVALLRGNLGGDTAPPTAIVEHTLPPTTPAPAATAPGPDADVTPVPGAAPTATALPARPTERPTPTRDPKDPQPEQPDCQVELPTLLEPTDNSSTYAGWQQTFKWQGGKLCGGVWQMTMDAQDWCQRVTGNEVTCSLPSNTGEHIWTVEWRADQQAAAEDNGLRVNPAWTLHLNQAPGSETCAPDEGSKPDCGKGKSPVWNSETCSWECRAN